MKETLLSLTACFVTTLAFAQHSFIGIQNSPRKGMIHAAMNPAEINHLTRKVEVNLFAVGATASNNTLTFRDIIKEGDLLDLALERAEARPIDASVEAHLLGPSFGFSVNKWSFGFLSQAVATGNIMNLDADLGGAFSDGGFRDEYYEVKINSSSNQRVNVSGYAKLGLLAGREVWANEKNVITVGGSFNFFVPGVYVNMGLSDLQGTYMQNQDESLLTNASGRLYISYPQDMENWDFEEQMLDRFSLSNISGFAMDLGVTHQFNKNGAAKLSSGLTIKNLGGLNLGSGQIDNSYAMAIPEGESFRLDLLEGDLDEIESQLLSSGYFTKSSLNGEPRASLPTIIGVYTDVHVSRIFHVSIYGQRRLSDQDGNDQLTVQNVFAITPRLKLGGFEIYSPWANYEVSGLTGGAGIRLGGFFVGSQSVLTGFLSDTQQVDVHVGLSLGFGKRKVEPDGFFSWGKQ